MLDSYGVTISWERLNAFAVAFACGIERSFMGPKVGLIVGTILRFLAGHTRQGRGIFLELPEGFVLKVFIPHLGKEETFPL